MTSIKVSDEVSIVSKDSRYIYKFQRVLHNREDLTGTTKYVDALRLAYWKNGKYKQDPPIMLEEEFIALVAKAAKQGLFRREKINKILLELALYQSESGFNGEDQTNISDS